MIDGTREAETLISEVGRRRAENAQLKADLAQCQHEIASLNACQCEGCDESLEGEAYCQKCFMRLKAELKAYEAIPHDKDGTPFAAAAAWRAECNRIQEQLEQATQREARLRRAVEDVVERCDHGYSLEYIAGHLGEALEEAGT